MTDPRIAAAISMIREDWEGVNGLIGSSAEVVADLEALDAELERLRAALRYICQPSMGFPASGPWEDLTPPASPDPEWWVRNGYGSPENIRLALATCIAQAKQALG